jgi:hypothetical protein
MDNALKVKLTKKIKYNENIHGTMDNYMVIIDELIESSKYIALSLKYPFLEDYSDLEVPTKYKDWQYRCCIELYKLQNSSIGSFVSYSENGLGWSKLTDGLPQSLLNEITPHVGVPQKEEKDV